MDGARPTSFASAIRIADPAHRHAVEWHLAAGRAEVVTLTEEEIQEAWTDVARTGVFCEPASAAGIAALRKRGVEKGALAVCVLTGPGLRDPGSTERIPERSTVARPALDAVREALAR